MQSSAFIHFLYHQHYVFYAAQWIPTGHGARLIQKTVFFEECFSCFWQQQLRKAKREMFTLLTNIVISKEPG